MFFLVPVFGLQAQDIVEFVVINDPNDTYVNLRKGNSIQSAVVKKLQNGSVMFCFGKKGNWMEVESMEEDEITAGYVYKDFVKEVTSFTEIKITDKNDQRLVLQGKGIIITIMTGLFNKQLHNYKYDATGNYIIAIDNKKIWGTDGGFPTSEYKLVAIDFNGELYKLPQEALQNLYNPDFSHTRAYYDEVSDSLYITSWNSDGAGGYCLAFVIKNKKYKERITETGF